MVRWAHLPAQGALVEIATEVLAKRRSSLGLLLQFIVEQGIAGESEFCRSFFDLHIEENEETGDSDSFLFKWSGVCY